MSLSLKFLVALHFCLAAALHSYTFPSGAVVDGEIEVMSVSTVRLSFGEEKVFISEVMADIQEASFEVVSLLFPGEVKSQIMSTMIDDIIWDKVLRSSYSTGDPNVPITVFGKQLGEISWVFVTKMANSALAMYSSQLSKVWEDFTAPGLKIVDLSSARISSIIGRESDLDNFVQRSMKDFDIPGVALGVIEDGSLVYSKGFGSTTLGGGEAVTVDTRFMIGSVTKSMTTFLISKLVDEQALSWDTKIRDLYSDLELSDPELVSTVTLQDFVSASTGLMRKDVPLLLGPRNTSLAQKLSDLSLLKRSQSKNDFQYCNQLVAAAGFLAAQVAYPHLNPVEGYQVLLEERLFKPLGMSRSTVNMDDVLGGTGFSYPYTKNTAGLMEPVSFAAERFATEFGPAGGVWSTISDMSRYAITELNEGVTSEGMRVLSSDGIHSRRQKIVATYKKDAFYGLGWSVSKKRGLNVVSHGGATMGFQSNLILYPDSRRAIIVLASGGTPPLLDDKLLELWFNVDLKTDQMHDQVLKASKEASDQFSKKLSIPTDEFMGPFLGTYYNSELGNFSVEVTEGKYFLVTSWGGKFPLSKWSSEAETGLCLDTFGAILKSEGAGDLSVEVGTEKYILTRNAFVL